MKKPKSKLTVVVVCLIMASAVGGLGYYLDQSRTQVVAQRKTLANLKQEAIDMEALQKQYAEIEASVEKVKRVLPATIEDIASFLEDVNAQASTSATAVTIDVEDVKEGSTPRGKKGTEGQEVEIGISITGSYINTTKLINSISLLPYYFLVDSVDMKLNKSGLIDTILKIRLNTTYHES